jgi:hypothetical protein
MRKFLIFLISLLFGVSVIYAQEAIAMPDAGWPVEERCVGAPTKPPMGWSYGGILFTQNSGMYSEDGGGFHAIRQQVATPYYIATNNKDIVYAGALSPDGKWFAVPYGYSIDQHIDDFGNSAGSEYFVNAIRIYRTDYTHLSYQIDWRLSDQNVVIDKIMWIDNDRLIYSLNEASLNKKAYIVVNPFTDERIGWKKVQEKLTLDQWKTFFHYSNPREDGWLIEPKVSQRTLEFIDQYRFNKSEIRWLPDLSGFVVFIPSSANSRQGLALFSEQDGLRSIITNNVVVQVKVSANGHYIAYQTTVTDLQNKEVPEINIADLQAQTITQLCYGADYPMFQWSPFSDQLAIRKDGVVSILDLDSWQLYDIAKNQGLFVGWRKGW